MKPKEKLPIVKPQPVAKQEDEFEDDEIDEDIQEESLHTDKKTPKEEVKQPI